LKKEELRNNAKINAKQREIFNDILRLEKGENKNGEREG